MNNLMKQNIYKQNKNKQNDQAYGYKVSFSRSPTYD